jgi:hypothetical protein
MSQLTDNEVLANFDGLTRVGTLNGDIFTQTGWNIPSDCPYALDMIVTSGDLNYHKDWSALMPVWYKFRDLKFDEVANQIEHSNIRTVIGAAILNEGPTPAAACALLANAIRWYNQIKSK